MNYNETINEISVQLPPPEEFFDISVYVGSDDYFVFEKIWTDNPIDSRLEGFTLSKNNWDDNRL